MEIEKTAFSEYFKKSVIYLGKSKPTFFILATIEFIELATNLTDHVALLFHFQEVYQYRTSKLSSLILKISPYQYYFNLLSEGYNNGFNSNYIMMVIFVGFYVWFLICLFNKRSVFTDDEMDKHKGAILLERFQINFFDYFLFRLLPFYSIDVFSREIVAVTFKEKCNALDYFLLAFSFLFLCFVTFLHCLYYSINCIWSNFQVVDSYFKYYPYDEFFSSKYDTFSYFLKFFVVFNQNYLFFNNETIDYISIFITLTSIGLFFGFFIYLFLEIFFSDSIMYLTRSFFNKCRIFYVLFIFEWIVFRLLLHNQEDYIPFLIYTVILIIFDIYAVVTLIDTLILSRVASDKNYLGVCWFIQNNDVDIQHFITEWITNHKTQCNERCCLICGEIGGEEKQVFSEIYSFEDDSEKTSSNKNMFVEYSNLLNKQKDKKRNTNLNKNLIIKIFPPYKFCRTLLTMASRSRKFMTEDDLIRLDFLKISVLLLSEKSIEFYLFSELCFLIFKYSENINVFVSLLLVFDIVRKTNLNIIKGFDIIKKNEDLRNSLKEYIQEYENFIHYGDKSPMNYIHISKKFANFKELVRSIHLLFKKNIECNYQLLIMRYAYETILHIQFNNTQPFDLNYYSDFLDFHYNNDKLFLLKYTINHDLFIITKGSKDLLKYQGKYFQNLFPDNFENIGINKYKKQLLNKEQKDIKPVFEFFVKSLINCETTGFIESFKMKYLIYPTTNVNELLIQGNYVCNLSLLMIFDSFENSERLDIFSAYVYKFTGLTPAMVHMLQHAGRNILFKDLFSNENLDKADQEKNIYKFSYEKYFIIYKKLIECEILKDSNHYNQFKEKSKEISSMARDKKEILFSLNKKWEFNDRNITYIIYSIKEIRRRNKPGQKTICRDPKIKTLDIDNDFNSSKDDNEDDDEEFDDEFEGKGAAIATSTLSSASVSHSGDSARSSVQRGKKGEKSDEKLRRSEELKRYTIIILLFSIVLVIITILFLVIEIQQNENFKSLYNLFESFRFFKRGLECSPLSLLSNYKFYTIFNESGVNVYEDYSKKVANDTGNPLFEKLLINVLIKTEIGLKYSSILERFDAYKSSIYKLGSKTAAEISALQGYTYSMTTDEKGLTLYKKEIDLTGLVREYNNIITSLVDGDSYISEVFSLINFGESTEYSRRIDLEQSKDVTTNKKNMLLLLLMYPFLHNGLTQTSELIEKLFDISLSSIEKYLIIFYVILLLLHFVLIITCIIFLMSYIKMMKINIMSSNQLFVDKKFLDLQNKRIEQIKLLNNLYSENPIKIMEKIELIDEMYRRITKSELSSAKKNNHSIFGSQESFQDDKSKSPDDVSKIGKKKLKNSNNNENDLLSAKNDMFHDSKLKQMGSFESQNSNNNNKKTSSNDVTDKNNDNNYYENIVSKSININSRHFKKTINKESFILGIGFSVYYIYNIIFFIYVYMGKNRLNKLIQYTDINNLIDGYLFDNINSLLYLYITNSTSIFYSQLISEDKSFDYIKDGIDSFYKRIYLKDILEKENNDIFPRVGDMVNLNCSEYIIVDKFFKNALNSLNISYNEYYSAVCSLFPVASTGSDTNMMMDLCYTTEVLYQQYEENKNFTFIFENYLQRNKLYELYTFVLTLCRIMRTYFNDNIFSYEINYVIGYFSTLIIVYLVLSVALEIGLFFVLNFFIISDVRKVNKLLTDFMSSLKF